MRNCRDVAVGSAAPWKHPSGPREPAATGESGVRRREHPNGRRRRLDLDVFRSGASAVILPHCAMMRRTSSSAMTAQTNPHPVRCWLSFRRGSRYLTRAGVGGRFERLPGCLTRDREHDALRATASRTGARGRRRPRSGPPPQGRKRPTPLPKATKASERAPSSSARVRVLSEARPMIQPTSDHRAPWWRRGSTTGRACRPHRRHRRAQSHRFRVAPPVRRPARSHPPGRRRASGRCSPRWRLRRPPAA